jgi:alcohol dehydrogenase class IV
MMNLLTESFSFRAPTEIHYGIGALDQLPELLRRLGHRRVLVVTDPGVARSGTLDRLHRALDSGQIGYRTFAEVEPDPALELVEAVRAEWEAARADAVIGLGGGSSIDTAKACSAAAVNEGDFRRFEGAGRVPRRGPDVVAVPTTAGTGSEVTHAMVLQDRARRYKLGIRSEHLAPRIAVLDPTVLTTLPRYVAACSGVDALSHAIEAYTSNQAEPFTDALALHAVRLIGRHLRAFVDRRQNLEAAAGMMVASTMAGIAFIWGRVAAVHALSHPLGARYHLPHGQVNAILLPAVMRFNLAGSADRFADLAVALGEPVSGASARDAAERAVWAVERLIRDLGIPRRLSEAGVTLDSTARREIAEEAMASGLMTANPREGSAADLESILQACA